MDRTSNTYQAGKEPFSHSLLRYKFNYEGDSVVWAESASIDSVKKALVLFVEGCVSAPTGYMRVEERRSGFVLKPSFLLPNLWEALTWMVWLDEWNGWPPPVCLECHKVFPQLTAHERKYCSPKCAHRATNRKWRRKDLRARKQKLKAKGVTDGTRKAR
jgi:hypothetical protein